MRMRLLDHNNVNVTTSAVGRTEDKPSSLAFNFPNVLDRVCVIVAFISAALCEGSGEGPARYVANQHSTQR
jgi:hypothetical protein